MEEMIILTRTFDLLKWLLPVCERFPKSQRFIVTRRLQDAALDFQEALFEANSRTGPARLERLRGADAHWSKLWLYLRLALHWNWLRQSQYEHVS